MVRYTAQEDYINDGVTIIDEKEELKTSFDSEIFIRPLEDAVTIVHELNKKEAIINVLYKALLVYDAEEDIEYWIKEAIEELEC